MQAVNSTRVTALLDDARAKGLFVVEIKAKVYLGPDGMVVVPWRIRYSESGAAKVTTVRLNDLPSNPTLATGALETLKNTGGGRSL